MLWMLLKYIGRTVRNHMVYLFLQTSCELSLVLKLNTALEKPTRVRATNKELETWR